MSDFDQEWTEHITPKVPFHYRIKTTDMMIMSRGCAWTADLLDPQGVVVGMVENDGNGGADDFHFTNGYQRAKFKEAVLASYGHEDAEAASWYMQEIEEAEEAK